MFFLIIRTHNYPPYLLKSVLNRMVIIIYKCLNIPACIIIRSCTESKVVTTLCLNKQNIFCQYKRIANMLCYISLILYIEINLLSCTMLKRQNSYEISHSLCMWHFFLTVAFILSISRTGKSYTCTHYKFLVCHQ